MICGDVMAQDEWCRQLFKNEKIQQELTRVVRRKNGNEVSSNMESKQKRTALVTGGSSGIGRCTAVATSKAGYIVYEFSRRRLLVHILRGLHRKIVAHQFV